MGKQWTPQGYRNRGRPKNVWKKRSGERNVDNRLQVQLEEDGGSSTGQSWMETSSLWLMLHREQNVLNQVNSSQIHGQCEPMKPMIAVHFWTASGRQHPQSTIMSDHCLAGLPQGLLPSTITSNTVLINPQHILMLTDALCNNVFANIDTTQNFVIKLFI